MESNVSLVLEMRASSTLKLESVQSVSMELFIFMLKEGVFQIDGI
jgi:hypothetical protein